MLDINLRDQRQAWVMKSDGSYELLQPANGGLEAVGTQQVLIDLARAPDSRCLTGRKKMDRRFVQPEQNPLFRGSGSRHSLPKKRRILFNSDQN